MDPRLNVIDERLSGVKKIVAISGGKGGVGKSSVASLLALILNNMGHKVGLLDLDLSGPSCHLILGVDDVFPEEEKGIIPPLANGIKFMSIVYFVKEKPLPFRGEDFSNAIIELLAITRWVSLDYLVIDMPPGIGDATLDVIRVIKNIEFVMVGNQSRLAVMTLQKILQTTKQSKKKVIGVIENMPLFESGEKVNNLKSLGVPFLGKIGFDKGYEEALGNKKKLLATQFAKDLKDIISNNPKSFFNNK
jgi:ATP-binding protein involved in chromosome partitioning